MGLKRKCECCCSVAMFCCSRCKSAFYCKQQHQKQHWKSHRVNCRSKSMHKQLFYSDDRSAMPRNTIKHFAGHAVNQLKITTKLTGDDEQLANKCLCELAMKDFVVIDRFLTEQQAQLICNDAKRFYSEYEGSFVPGLTADGHGGREIRGDYVKWLDQRTILKRTPFNVLVEGTDRLAAAFSKDNGQATATNHTDAMLTFYPGNGASYKMHLDSTADDNRLLTFIYYLNEDYCPSTDGGCLRVYTEDTASCVDIEPILNRLIVFAARKVKHEVQPSHAGRFACTVWYNDQV